MSEVAHRVMGREEAERLTERVRMVATTLMDSRQTLMRLLDDAVEGKVWDPLGMRSLEEWTQFTFSETPLAQLPREDRKVIVGDMAQRGMSTRAIAPVVGVHHDTVARDVRSVVNTTDAPRTVNGIDGHTRTFQPRTANDPTNPAGADTPKRRRAITDQAAEIGWEVRKEADKLLKLLEDDRFTRNKEEVTAHLRGHLEHMMTACNAVLDA